MEGTFIPLYMQSDISNMQTCITTYPSNVYVVMHAIENSSNMQTYIKNMQRTSMLLCMQNVIQNMQTCITTYAKNVHIIIHAIGTPATCKHAKDVYVWTVLYMQQDMQTCISNMKEKVSFITHATRHANNIPTRTRIRKYARDMRFTLNYTLFSLACCFFLAHP